MPIQEMNYAMAPISPDPFSQLVPALLQGVKLGSMPKQMQQMDADIKAQKLANQLAQINMKYAEPMAQAQIAEKQALAPYYQAMAASLPQRTAIDMLNAQNAQQKIAAQQQAYDEKVQAEQQQKRDLAFKDLLADASKASESAAKLNQLASQFDTSYQGLGTFEKGSLGGKLAPLSSGAQSTDRASNLMVAQMLGLFPGRVTNTQLQYLQGLKPNRTMNPEAEKEAISQLVLQGNRLQEYLPFIVKAKQMGMSPESAQQLWLQYNNENPIFDKDNKPLSQNIGKWQRYFSSTTTGTNPDISRMPLAVNNTAQEHLAKFFQHSGAKTSPFGGPQGAAQKALGQNNPLKQQLSKIMLENPGKTIVKDPNGKLHAIAKSRLAEARKKYPELEVMTNG